MASASPRQDGHPPSNDVRAQVQRMTSSEIFASSPQLASFLIFVVEAVLRGHGERLKGYTIGVEVMRRDTKFDPQIDPIVRVEATRLRRAIERYYAGPGIDDVIAVSLPVGSYVPEFSYAEITAERRKTIGRSRRGPMPSASPNVGNGMPALLIRTIEYRGAPDADEARASILEEKLRNAFSRFDTINIVPSANEQSRAASSLTTAEQTIDYEFGGVIHYQGSRTANALFELF